MRTRTPGALLLALALAVPLVTAGKGPPPEVEWCHYDHDTDAWLYETTSAKGVDKGHGGHDRDGAVGDGVPGMDGHVFGGDCVPQATIADADGDGVADDVDNCPTVANAGQDNTYGLDLIPEVSWPDQALVARWPVRGDACEDLDRDGVLDVDEDHICVVIRGIAVMQRGSASCDNVGGTAIANGINASALAGTASNVAIAIGSNMTDNTQARGALANGNFCPNGSGNTMVAVGDNHNGSDHRNHGASATLFCNTSADASVTDNILFAIGDNKSSVRQWGPRAWLDSVDASIPDSANWITAVGDTDNSGEAHANTVDQSDQVLTVTYP